MLFSLEKSRECLRFVGMTARAHGQGPGPQLCTYEIEMKIGRERKKKGSKRPSVFEPIFVHVNGDTHEKTL